MEILIIILFYFAIMIFLGIIKGISESLPMFTQHLNNQTPVVPVKREQTREELLEELRQP
jgi:hypothetical protein